MSGEGDHHGPVAGRHVPAGKRDAVARAKRDLLVGIPASVLVGTPRTGSTGCSGGIRERSAEQIVDELQTLSVGDRVPDSPDWSVFFTVAQVQPPHALVLHSSRHVLRPMRAIDFSWAFVLRPLHHNRTRFLVRVRASYRPRWSWLVLGAPYLIGDFLNTGNILRAVKARVEAHPAPTPT